MQHTFREAPSAWNSMSVYTLGARCRSYPDRGSDHHQHLGGPLILLPRSWKYSPKSSLHSLFLCVSQFSLPSIWSWFCGWCKVGVKINKQKPLNASQVLREKQYSQTLSEKNREENLPTHFMRPALY